MSKALSLNFKVLSFIMMIFCIYSCTKKKKAETQVDSSAQAVLGLTALDKIDPLDGRILVIKNLTAKNIQVVPKNTATPALNLLEIAFEEDPAADYYSFVICTTQNVCSPTLVSPGQVLHSPFIYPYAPAGTLNIQVKACLRTYNAISEDKTCGPALTTVFQQKQNPDGTLLSLVKRIYDLEQEILKRSVDLRQSFLKFHTNTEDLIKTDPTLKDMRTVALNVLNAGQDPITQLLSSSLVTDVYNTLAQSADSTGTGTATTTGSGTTTTGGGLKLDDSTTIITGSVVGGSMVLGGALVLVGSLVYYSSSRVSAAKAAQDAEQEAVTQAVLARLAVTAALADLSEAQRKAYLNIELQKVKAYRTLQDQILKDTEVGTDGKHVTGSELHQIMMENPDTVIEKAALHIELLEAAKEGLTGPKLARKLRLDKLDRIIEGGGTLTTDQEADRAKLVAEFPPPPLDPVPAPKTVVIDESISNSLERNKAIVEARTRVEADYLTKHPSAKLGTGAVARGIGVGALVAAIPSLLGRAMALDGTSSNSPSQTLTDELNATYQAIMNNRMHLAKFEQDLAILIQKPKSSNP